MKTYKRHIYDTDGMDLIQRIQSAYIAYDARHQIVLETLNSLNDTNSEILKYYTEQETIAYSEFLKLRQQFEDLYVIPLNTHDTTWSLVYSENTIEATVRCECEIDLSDTDWVKLS